MTFKRLLHAARLAPVCLAALVLCGCTDTAPPPNVEHAEGNFWEQNNRAMSRMMAGMEVKPTGDVDTDFARMMIPHHQGAIDMAKAQLRFGKNGQLLTLAREIINKQEQEIAIMRASIREVGALDARNVTPMDMKNSHHTM